MTKSELKTGHIVTTRCGNRYVVFIDTGVWGHKDNSFLVRKDYFCTLSCFTETLEYLANSDYDIVKVEAPLFPADLCEIFQCKDKTTIWERSKKMTVSEIEKILGYNVEIVSDK